MREFISEDDLKTFEGWLNYQGYDPTMLAPDDLAKWHEVYDEISKRPDAKIGLMKLGSKVPGDRVYAVAIRDSGLDLVEPNCEPLTWPGKMVRQEVFKDAVPWIVIRVFRKPLLGAAA